MRFRMDQIDEFRKKIKDVDDGQLVDYALRCSRKYKEYVGKLQNQKKPSFLLWREARKYSSCYNEIKRELKLRGSIIGDILDRDPPSKKLRFP